MCVHNRKGNMRDFDIVTWRVLQWQSHFSAVSHILFCRETIWINLFVCSAFVQLSSLMLHFVMPQTWYLNKLKPQLNTSDNMHCAVYYAMHWNVCLNHLMYDTLTSVAVITVQTISCYLLWLLVNTTVKDMFHVHSAIFILGKEWWWQKNKIITFHVWIIVNRLYIYIMLFDLLGQL